MYILINKFFVVQPNPKNHRRWIRNQPVDINSVWDQLLILSCKISCMHMNPIQVKNHFCKILWEMSKIISQLRHLCKIIQWLRLSNCMISIETCLTCMLVSLFYVHADITYLYFEHFISLFLSFDVISHK
jgi:hypothetical protein